MPYNHPREIEEWSKLRGDQEQRIERELDLSERVGFDIEERRALKEWSEQAAQATPDEREEIRVELGSILKLKKKAIRKAKKDAREAQATARAAESALRGAEEELAFLKRMVHAADFRLWDLPG
jgi:hypothetical protein